MENELLVVLVAFQATFLLLDVLVLTKTGRDIARKEERTAFCMLVGLHMVYLICNSIWTLQEYEVLHLPETVAWILCTVNLWTVISTPAAFFLFMVQRMQMKNMKIKAARRVMVIPAVIYTVLCVLSPLTGWGFTLTETEHVVRGPLYPVMTLCSSIYLLAVAGSAAYNAVKGRTLARRQAGRSILLAVLIILLYVAVDDMLRKTTILPAAIFAVIIVIFITMQEYHINSDALTGMNNRRKADSFLTERLDDVSEKEPLYLCMCDLDNFKAINDSYGHAAGDEALILTSQAMKRAIARYDGFAARFGGDEFLMVWQPKEEGEREPEMLTETVNALLAELAEGKPYQLHMTMGYARCTDPAQPADYYMKAADDMLYRRKKEARVGR